MNIQSVLRRASYMALLALSFVLMFASTLTLSGAPGSIVRISWTERGIPGRQYTYPFRAGVNHFSADNRYVVFSSDASNLVDDENGSVSDIFVYDVLQDTIEIISRASSADGLPGEQGNGSSYFPSISADGRFVAFQSYSTNLDAGDTDYDADIFVYDRQSKSIELISRSGIHSGVLGEKGNRLSAMPVISADGRYVAFQSYANNLVDRDRDDVWDIYLYDRQTKQVELVSGVGNKGGQLGAKGNSFSTGPAISSDGRYVAFQSAADNLVDVDTHGYSQIYVLDRHSDTVKLISRASGKIGVQEEGGNNPSSAVSISGDGRYIAYRSSATNLAAGAMGEFEHIFVYDQLVGTTDLISRASSGNGLLGESADGHSFEPSISSDGRYVSFRSHASNLVHDETSVYGHIFVYDRQKLTVELVSAGTLGDHADSGSLYSAISSDGHTVMFSSYAQNLAGPQPYRQVFIKKLSVNDLLERSNGESRVKDHSEEAVQTGFNSSLESVSAHLALAGSFMNP
jgi:Tol biopolymer transport system component